MEPDEIFMVFDVESIGLHGEGFAVGWVVVDSNGVEHASGSLCCPPARAKGMQQNRDWVAKNVAALPITHDFPVQIRSEFWKEWQRWNKNGAVLVADCAWPVEARFLAMCVDDAPVVREWTGPYPMHDLASLMLAAGRDPLSINERLPTELPAHHPVNDARQSARLLVETLRLLPATNPR